MSDWADEEAGSLTEEMASCGFGVCLPGTPCECRDSIAVRLGAAKDRGLEEAAQWVEKNATGYRMETAAAIRALKEKKR